MARTSVPQVQALLGINYDGTADLQQFIDTASPVVDQVVSLAAQKPVPVILPTALQELVERWLACFFYCQQDPLYVSKSTVTSGSFQRAPSTNDFDANDYGKSACRIDYSGILTAIGKRQVAQGYWMGKSLSQQIPYCDRQ